MLTKDRLWKAIFEDFFPQAILFYFSEHYHKIDWKRGYVMLDKELQELFPESEGNERRVDILAKVWLLDGTEQWILIHIEVQGYKDDDFAERMFIYYYRATDRFGKPISALAILTDPNKNWRPDHYLKTCMGTKLLYEFPVFKLADYSEEDFDNDPNPWAIVMKAALTGLKANWTDESLLQVKIKIYKDMRERGYTKKQVRNLLVFIKFYVRFRKKEFFHKFESERQKIENIKKQPMGIVELVKEHLIEEAKQEGMEEGLVKGIEKGMERGDLKRAITGIRNMHKKGFGVDDIADLLEVPKSLVVGIIKQLEKEYEIIHCLRSDLFRVEEIADKLKISHMLVQVLNDSLKK